MSWRQFRPAKKFKKVCGLSRLLRGERPSVPKASATMNPDVQEMLDVFIFHAAFVEAPAIPCSLGQ